MRPSSPNLGLLLVRVARAHRNRLEAALGEIGLPVGQEHALYQLSLRRPNDPAGHLSPLLQPIALSTQLVLLGMQAVAAAAIVGGLTARR